MNLALKWPMRFILWLSLLILGSFHSFGSELSCHEVLLEVENSQTLLSSINNFKNQMAKISIDDPGKNKIYIDLALHSFHEGLLFFQIENAVLKELNDKIIVDKELVTALDTFLKTKILNLIDQNSLLQKHLKAQYSDFKTLHFVFDNDSNMIRSQLENIYKLSMTYLLKKSSELGLSSKYSHVTGLGQSPLFWYMAGFGETNDKANFAARLARQMTVESKMVAAVDFKKIENVFIDYLEKIEDLRRKFYDPKLAPIFEKIDQVEVFSLDFIEIFRKVKTDNLKDYVSEIQLRTQERFHLDLSSATVLLMKEYYETLDLFSPSLLIERRIQIDMSKTVAGNFSIDLVGMGARNFQRLMAATIAHQNSSVDVILKSIRQSEIMATEELLEMRNRVREAIREVEQIRKGKKFEFGETFQHTGDDIVYFPTNGELDTRHKVAILQKLALVNQIGNFRPVFLSQNNLAGVAINNNDRIKFLVNGEIIEKSYRLKLEKVFQFSHIKKMIISIDITLDQNNRPLYDLYIVKGNSVLPQNAKFKTIAEDLIKSKFDGTLRKIRFL